MSRVFASCEGGRGFEPEPSHAEDKQQNWYLSLTNIALGITKVEQGVDWLGGIIVGCKGMQCHAASSIVFSVRQQTATLPQVGLSPQQQNDSMALGECQQSHS
jgi:hypothetical protein